MEQEEEMSLQNAKMVLRWKWK